MWIVKHCGLGNVTIFDAHERSCWGWDIRTLCHICNDVDDNDDDDDNDDSENNESLSSFFQLVVQGFKDQDKQNYNFARCSVWV
jgi:hypothetical protein